MAEIILKQSNPGFIDGSGVGADALDKRIDALRVRINSHPLQGGQWFKSETPSGGVFKVSTYGTILQLPPENQDSDRIPMATPWKGFPIQFTLKNYRLGTQIERSFQEDELMAVATRMASGLMNAGRVLHEHSFASIINNAQTAADIGADGMPLSSTAHPFERRQQGTWSNQETASALTHGNFNTARKNMRKRTDEYGDVQPIKPIQLVTVPDKEQKAKEIFASERVDDNALNTKNVWKDAVSIFIYDWMTGTTPWFLWGDRYENGAEDHGLHHVRLVDNIAPTQGQDKSTDIIGGRRLRMRFIDGFSTEKNLQYNAGA